MNKSLVNLSSLVAVGFLPYFISFFSLPIYSKYLSKEEFGIIGISMASILIASTWSNFQLPGALSRMYFDYKGLDRDRYISTVVNSSFLLTGLFSALYFFLSDDISGLIFSSDVDSRVIHVSIFVLLFNSSHLTLERILINKKQGGKILLRGIVCQSLSVCLGLFLVVEMERGVLGFLWSQAFYFFSMSVFSLVLLRRHYIFCLKFSYFYESVTYSFPLIFHALGAVVFMYAGTFFIETYLSLTLLGVFFIAEKFSQLVKALVNSINNVIMPKYNQISVTNTLKGNDFLEKIIPIWLAVFVPIIVLYVFLADKFIETYMKGEFDGVFNILLIICLSYLFRGLYCFVTAPLFFHKETKVIPKITMMTGFLSLIFNWVLVPFWGLIGAAASIFLSFLTSFILARFFSKDVYSVTIKIHPRLMMMSAFLFLSPMFVLYERSFWVFSLGSLIIILSGGWGLYRFDIWNVKSFIFGLREHDER
ncbi:lipopolysaccharide biosynthesis protein [Agarivorans sp. DSG3-1]|uniref:lipopolysaccharide biosynthesis protein n=1 Tax=Agarivorans sp. DSG3-1 TaxID=3342249 RepID=UPI00398F2EC5